MAVNPGAMTEGRVMLWESAQKLVWWKLLAGPDPGQGRRESSLRHSRSCGFGSRHVLGEEEEEAEEEEDDDDRR